MQTQKSWTVLIYLNGRNELKPEIMDSMSSLLEFAPYTDINVVIQVGNIENRLVNILRPDCNLSNEQDSWLGVRRYYIKNNRLVLLDDIGDKNMSSPDSLFSFLRWGIQNFRANHIMLILGGHGYQFVGCMTDYSQEAPYIMGFPEIFETIDKVGKQMKKSIDILVMDTCYFNFIETIYEVGKRPEHTIKRVITPIIKNSITGLPYELIIQMIRESNCGNDINGLIKYIINNLYLELVGFDINHFTITQIKGLISELAFVYKKYSTDNNKNNRLNNLHQLLHCNDKSLPWFSLSKEILSLSKELIIDYNAYTLNNLALLNIADIPTNEKRKYLSYSKLSFAKNNYWSNLLFSEMSAPNNIEGYIVKENVNKMNKNDIQPYKLMKNEVYGFLSTMNPTLTKKEKLLMLEKLYKYKKWNGN